MQCQSYFPVYHSHYDINADANGGARPMYSGNGTFRNVHYNNNYVSSSPVPQAPFAYGKEFLRQTMLMHEVTFRDQVQELHRLYSRQRELMDEIKTKELYMNHIHLEAQASNSFSAKLSSTCGQYAQHDLSLASRCWPSTTGADIIQTSLNSPNERTLASTVSKNGSILNNLHSPESKGKKIGGKLLDLELPAEVYIDTEEGESLQDAPFYEAPTSPSSSSNKLSKVAVETDQIASVDDRLLGFNSQGGSTSPGSCARTNINLADLNEPPTTSRSEKIDKIPENGETKSGLEILERSPDLIICGNVGSDGAPVTPYLASQLSEANSLSPVRCQKKSSSNIEMNSSVVQALPCLTNQPSSSKGTKVCRNKKSIPLESKTKEPMASSSSINSVCLKHVNGLNYFDLNSSAVIDADFTPSEDMNMNSMDGENARKSKKCRLIDINLPCDPTAEEKSFIEDSLVGQINSNLYANEGRLPSKSSLDKVPLEIDLEAPPSPEVEERPPPRGESEENQPEETLQELVKIAAEVIVSISSSKSQPFLESSDLHKDEVSDSTALEWFAGVIQSLSVDLEDDLGTSSHMDDFEAMTLNLTEMNAEEYWCNNSDPIENITCSMLPGQMRKGRTRRSKRKDFQREVLPSLASLSRYEVTEDIQIIEGLLEAAGTPWHLSRSRRACRVGRKPRTAKQQQQQTSTFDVPDSKDGGVLVSWGKINRRPRGRRIPASPSKWLEQVI